MNVLASTCAAPDAETGSLRELTKLIQDIKVFLDPVLGSCWDVWLTNGAHFIYRRNADGSVDRITS
jgi:hypothetical protein